MAGAGWKRETANGKAQNHGGIVVTGGCILDFGSGFHDGMDAWVCSDGWMGGWVVGGRMGWYLTFTYNEWYV